MTKWTIWDYLQDISGIRLNSFYGSTIVLGILWIAGIVGLFSTFIPGLKESLYSLSTLSNPTYLLILLSLIPFDIFWHRNTIRNKLKDLSRQTITLRLWMYIMWTITSIGFGVIFGTLGLFADGTKNIQDYAFVIAVSLSFSNIAAIIARGYIRDSPVAGLLIKISTRKNTSY